MGHCTFVFLKKFSIRACGCNRAFLLGIPLYGRIQSVQLLHGRPYNNIYKKYNSIIESASFQKGFVEIHLWEFWEYLLGPHASEAPRSMVVIGMLLLGPPGNLAQLHSEDSQFSYGAQWLPV